MSDTTKTEVRVIEGWAEPAASFSKYTIGHVLYESHCEPELVPATLVIRDKAVPMSKVVELYKAINNGAWERIDGALRVNAVTQEHITQCFKDIGIELEPPF